MDGLTPAFMALQGTRIGWRGCTQPRKSGA